MKINWNLVVHTVLGVAAFMALTWVYGYITAPKQVGDSESGFRG